MAALELIPAMRYDFQAVREMDGALSTAGAIRLPMLLLSGTQSPACLQNAVRSLAAAAPDAIRVELAGLDQSGPWNADRGGHPAIVSAALCDFFE